jgi:hypothetical protein
MAAAVRAADLRHVAPRQFGLEFEAQLRAPVLGQPVICAKMVRESAARLSSQGIAAVDFAPRICARIACRSACASSESGYEVGRFALHEIVVVSE